MKKGKKKKGKTLFMALIIGAGVFFLVRPTQAQTESGGGSSPAYGSYQPYVGDKGTTTTTTTETPINGGGGGFDFGQLKDIFSFSPTLQAPEIIQAPSSGGGFTDSSKSLTKKEVAIETTPEQFQSKAIDYGRAVYGGEKVTGYEPRFGVTPTKKEMLFYGDMPVIGRTEHAEKVFQQPISQPITKKIIIPPPSEPVNRLVEKYRERGGSKRARLVSPAR